MWVPGWFQSHCFVLMLQKAWTHDIHIGRGEIQIVEFSQLEFAMYWFEHILMLNAGPEVRVSG